MHAAIVLCGEHYFGWKASWDLNSEWYCLTLDLRQKMWHLGKTDMPEWSAGRAPSLRVQH